MNICHHAPNGSVGTQDNHQYYAPCTISKLRQPCHQMGEQSPMQNNLEIHQVALTWFETSRSAAFFEGLAVFFHTRQGYDKPDLQGWFVALFVGGNNQVMECGEILFDVPSNGKYAGQLK